MSSETADYVPVADLEELEAEGRQIVSAGGRSMVLFHHEGEVHAVDNRCPHMGFPLHEGTVDDGILTCHWHHARFELSCGDTFDPWADDVQTFPVELRDGEVLVDPSPAPDEDPVEHLRERLRTGLEENLNLVVAKSVIGLDAEDVPPTEPLGVGVEFGTRYREGGWGRGLVTLTAMANLVAEHDLRPEDRQRALYRGLVDVADDTAGEPPRFGQPSFSARDLGKERLEEWFRETVEVRDDDGAERCLRTAVEVLGPADVADVVYAAATDHLYMDAGHTFDFVTKALEAADHLGWDRADEVVPSVVPQLTGAQRSEELNSWRQPVDVAGLTFAFHDDLPDLLAAGEGEQWVPPEGFVDTLLSDDPEATFEALRSAVRSGATAEQVADRVALAAARRVAQFGTSNEFNDWNTVHHTYTFANAVHRATARTDSVPLYRAAAQGAASVYLDRFLNTPPTPIPGERDPDAAPDGILDDLLETFDEEGHVDEAGRLVADYFDAGGDVADLKRTLGQALVREDAGFHTLQNVEASFAQHDLREDFAERRLVMLATARYMAAHFPTRREDEQTFSIAERLHAGEQIHEA